MLFQGNLCWKSQYDPPTPTPTHTRAHTKNPKNDENNKNGRSKINLMSSEHLDEYKWNFQEKFRFDDIKSE